MDLNFQKSEILRHYPMGKRLEKLFYRKGISATRKLCEVCKKNPVEKMRFQLQKHEKY